MEPNQQLERTLWRLAEVCAVGAGLLAFAALSSWVLGEWQITALGDDYKQMAPKTACLITLFSSGILLFLRFLAKPSADGFALVAVFSAGTHERVERVQFLLGIEQPGLHWLVLNEPPPGVKGR